MDKMNSYNTKVSIISTIKLISGGFLALFGMAGLSAATDAADIAMGIVAFLIFLLPGIALCYSGIKAILQKKSQNIIYGYIKAKNKVSIDEISQRTAIRKDKATNIIIKMIGKDLVDGYINNNNELVLNRYEKIRKEETKNIKMESVKCTGCGAINKVVVGTTKECEYCGMILSTKSDYSSVK